MSVVECQQGSYIILYHTLELPEKTIICSLSESYPDAPRAMFIAGDWKDTPIDIQLFDQKGPEEPCPQSCINPMNTYEY